ncbi:hypothetical protein K502DRAFT_129695 [Neoconidiobolus thromboides FSU 785]|nr:hypothetical protein K502DRAFT_129695 [Neoconidiobolus thromboides FSU 785]
MTTSNMNFGPEWMRKLASTDKAASSDSIEQDSTLQEPSQLPTSTTSYSSITGKLREDGSRSEDNDTIDSLNPFKYSKEYMLSFFKEIAAPLDFEKHEIASVEECLQPISFSPLSELEQKLISSGQVNSSSNRRIVQNQHTQNQQHRNLERNNREGNTNRGGRGGARTNYNRNNGGGGGWGNVSKSSIGTFGSDGVFRMEGAGDSLEGSDFAMTAEMFEAERRVSLFRFDST